MTNTTHHTVAQFIEDTSPGTRVRLALTTEDKGIRVTDLVGHVASSWSLKGYQVLEGEFFDISGETYPKVTLVPNPDMEVSASEDGGTLELTSQSRGYKFKAVFLRW